MSVLKFLLLPFAMLYDVLMNVRNKLYDQGTWPSVSFDIPVIGVGNLAVGGTGKTPMTEHLIRLLSPQYKIVTLSRGYGRKTKGFRIAAANDNASTIGDEPYQMFKKFSPAVGVTVGEERALAIPTLLQELPETNVVVMDDAFQHRKVNPGFNILLTEYGRPFYDDNVLPYGRLREGPEGAKRADVIVITKCPPHLEEEEIMKMEHAIREYSLKPVFFSKIRYGEPVSFGDPAEKISSKIILISAIANSHILEDYVRKSFTLEKHYDFRDHYVFKPADLQEAEELVKKYPEGTVSILTTEKDMVKLEADELKPYVSRLPLFYLPIETEFLRNGADFDTLVTSFLNNFNRD
ncbi:MAG TPA: tetraacyldisaccharide 4'-kinase [Cyclobacteriaceae bacterium]|nr:tetraacyldisaccharide 4'-kinase [Cyclobacteriaceae bacterium]